MRLTRVSPSGQTMSFILQPWQFFFVILVGWIHREQQKIIEFYRLQVEALMEAQGKKRLLLTDDQRRLLAVKGKSLGRKALMELTTIVTPDTILRWHRTLVAKKWDYSDCRKSAGRPRVKQEIVDLVLRFAGENPSWGYDRIQGALANLGHEVSDQTVGNILKEHGIEPAPDRKRQTTWKTFIKSHWGRPRLDRLHDYRSLGRRVAWSRTTCCSSWNWPRGEFTSPDAHPIPTSRG